MIVARQLRAENLAIHFAQLQETRTVASPNVSADSHPVNSGFLDRTFSVSETRTVASP